MGVLYSLLVFPGPKEIGYRVSPNQRRLGYAQKGRDGRTDWVWTPAIWMKTSKGVCIPAAYLKQTGAQQTILYSHANAEDLGASLKYAKALMKHLNVNVFVYEYSSYGHSYRPGSDKVVPSEGKTYADITAAYNYLRADGVEPNNIILFGRSLGSCPSCFLASEEEVGGIVLIGGLASILRVVAPWLKVTLPFDIFPNIDFMKKIRCPVLSVHGEKDGVVRFSHAVKLLAAAHAQSFEPYWHPEGKHNDVEELNWECLMMYYEGFLSAVQSNELSGTTRKEPPPAKSLRGKLRQCFPCTSR